MEPTKLERMISLADEFFGARNDPDQISVSDDERTKLMAIDPSTLSERRVDDGPVAWILLLPTTLAIEERFLRKEITERELLDLTPVGGSYNSIYLCSALVLPEFRSHGIARALTEEAVRSMCSRHHIKELFAWIFSSEGKRLAETVAAATGLPLRFRPA
jgi:hypothetical protein